MDNGLIEEDNTIVMRDEDYCCNLFYCNPKDSRVFVPKRFGYGVTLNMGRVSCLVFVAIMFVFIAFAFVIADCIDAL